MDSGDLFTDLTLDPLTPSSLLREENRRLPAAPASEKSRRRPAVTDEEPTQDVPLEVATMIHKIDSLA
jgi:hypothetical protein